LDRARQTAALAHCKVKSGEKARAFSYSTVKKPCASVCTVDRIANSRRDYDRWTDRTSLRRRDANCLDVCPPVMRRGRGQLLLEEVPATINAMIAGGEIFPRNEGAAFSGGDRVSAWRTRGGAKPPGLRYPNGGCMSSGRYSVLNIRANNAKKTMARSIGVFDRR